MARQSETSQLSFSSAYLIRSLAKFWRVIAPPRPHFELTFFASHVICFYFRFKLVHPTIVALAISKRKAERVTRSEISDDLLQSGRQVVRSPDAHHLTARLFG